MPRENFYSGVLLDNAFFEQKEISETIVPVQPQTALPALSKIQTVPENVKDKFVDLKRHDTVNTQETTDDKDSKLRDFSVVAVKKNKRQSIIISLLKRKKEVMIKDITETITDCSEKTIQRELAALVDEGILKKEGERRWTRYMLA
jgi:predicted HTH transcriptional regulator